MIPTPLDVEILDWFSRRRAVRRASIPSRWRGAVRRMLDEDAAIPWAGGPWLERTDVVLVRITETGRALAAAYRHGRTLAASIPIDEDLDR